MAMMMTGRVLLVCALCVLWCGAGGRSDGEDTAGSGIGGESPLSSQELETPPQVTQDLRRGAGGLKEELPPAPSEDEVEEDEDEDNDDDGAGTDEAERTERQGDQEVAVTSDPNSGEKNLIGSRRKNHQPIVSAGDISHSGSREPNANPTQKEVEEKKDETDENTPAVENALTTGNGEHTLPVGIAGGNPPPPPEDDVDSREQDGEDTTSGGKKKVQSPETAAAPQSHRDKGSEGNGEDTKATTVTANTTDTTNTQNSDGSTAVSHTTSPLLLLLLVACAAAAAVVPA
ncbi:Mucin-associated surface protein (MASP) [Trypanosoma cruzi]|uniref:Mucin-associated surface protein (MASP), putative n=2 Tax=Trypanosoma cruzi TaxID=5693 RepID=Q4E060_TRYCC|nr:mucin-associated surface protein (MASP), putative [Trypanosoma cruzi]EAN98169.1 mucin-associated surface protein (MASP), putative [Trypanosoma cruzi]PWV09782.1 Mucin-associated surface protein (MASP) [Trypanosoma cruzi]|eukprot:XP_820020.1 mucin-associated surface protein (MASP) [Trypanosoma cruzi strain CL Brener]